MAIEVSSKNNVNPTITISEGVLDTTSTALELPGNLYKNWGVIVNKNLYWIMENFAGSTSPSPAVIGQLWFDTTTNSIKVYNGTNWVNPVSVTRIEISKPADIDGKTGDLLLVNNTNEKSLYVHDGTSWISIFRFVTSITTPTSAENGTIWFNSNSSALSMYADGTFHVLNGSGGTTSLTVENFKEDNNDFYIIKIDTNIIAAFSPVNFTFSAASSFDSVNIQSFFPNGISDGFNLSNFVKNITFTNNSDVTIENKGTGKIKLMQASQEVIKIDSSLVSIEKNLKVSGNSTFNSPVDFNNTSYVKIPTGTNAQRPVSPVEGMFRYNSDTKQIEYYDGNNWIEVKSSTIKTSNIEYNIPFNGFVMHPHGETTKPSLFFAFAKCINAQGGYNPGDEILLAHQTDFDEGGSPSRDFFSTWADNTNIGFAAMNQVRITEKNGGGFIIISNSTDFKLIFKWIP